MELLDIKELIGNIQESITKLNDQLEEVVGLSGSIIMNHMLTHGDISKDDIYDELKNIITKDDIERLFNILVNVNLLYNNKDKYAIKNIAILQEKLT